MQNVFILALALCAHSAMATESNTIPTSQLVSMAYVMTEAGATTATAAVELNSVSVVDGKIAQEPVDLSTNEKIIFLVNGQSAVLDPNQDLELPLFSGATYNMNFQRASGELFSASAVLPSPANFLAPAQGANLNKADEVVVKWSTPLADDQAIVIESTCSEPMKVDVDDNFTSMTLAAGWAINCKGPVAIAITHIAINGGQGFGEFGAFAQSVLKFSYDGSAAAPFTMPAKRKTEIVRKGLKSKSRIFIVHSK